MKLLISLIILIAMLIPFVACGNQSDSVRASPNNEGSLVFTSEGEPTVEAQILGIKLALQDLNERLEALELKIFGELFENPWSPQSFEARLKVIEEKLGITRFSW